MKIGGDHKRFMFNADEIRFGKISIAGGDLPPKTVELSLTISGIGLPYDDYLNVARMLYKVEPSLICPSGTGSFCRSEKYCAQLLEDIEDISMFIHFPDYERATNNKFELPIAALMRQQDSKCQLLISNLGESSLGQNVVLGSAFFQ